MTHGVSSRAVNPFRTGIAIGAMLAVLTLSVTAARAYNRYNDGCQTCHGQYTDDPYNSPKGGAAWPDSLHAVHRASAYMNADCDLCHTSGDGRDPYIGSSNGTSNNIGYGCVGCHGRDYGSTTGVSGVGLRAHHDGAGVTSCAGCHSGDPSPLDESVAPPYFGTADTDADFTCNDDASTSEDWSGDGIGLDNDGDDLYDLNDTDCTSTGVCGDSVIDAPETCDPPSSCPTTCDDSDVCTTDAMAGTPATCDVVCTNTPITTCANGDGCCSAGCDATNDDDCSDSCGDGTIDVGETCDPPSSCPTTCDDSDACTDDTLTGDAANCNVACSNVAITACTDDDGCCPGGCDEATDNNCSTDLCGNGVLDPGETCDPPGSCPTTCEDNDVCTADTLTGSAATCDATCTNVTITVCTDNDGCCPAGCDSATDSATDSDCTTASADDSGCGCHTSSDGAPTPTALLALLLLLGLLRRRRP